MTFAKLARLLGRGAVLARDASAVERSIRQRSPKPLAKRVVNKQIGRVIGRATRGVWWK